MKRTKLIHRILPDYTRGEEIMNMVTHIVGAGFSIPILVLCIIRSALHENTLGIITAAIYGCSMITLYCISSIYHGLHASTAKKVLQIIDRCTIYFLIAGTYTPIVMCALCPVYPVLGWGLLIEQWSLAILAAALTAIDLKKYNVFSMICYIIAGWSIIPFTPQVIQVLTQSGFWLLLSGGIAYTVGAVLYGIGSKVRWMHSVFHIFVVIGSLLQFLSIFFFVL